MTDGESLLDTNVLVHAYVRLDEEKQVTASGIGLPICPGGFGEDQQEPGHSTMVRYLLDLTAANLGEMPDAWKRTGMFEERTIGSNQWAIELYGEC